MPSSIASKKLADGPLVFLHILKTGGYSICQELFSRTALGAIHNGSPEQYDAMVPARVADSALFVGHFSFRHLRNIPSPGFLFSMVREPVDRAISSYFFLRHQASLTDAPYLERQIALAREYDLKDILERAPDFDIISKNHQANVFFDDWRLQADADARTLNTALANSERFDLVGIFERYDESMQMLCARLGWKPWPSGVKLNTTRQRVTIEDLDGHTAKLLRRANEVDIELYTRLRDRFEREFRDTMRRLVRIHALHTRQGANPASPPPAEVDLFADAAMDGEGWHTREVMAGGYVRWLGPGNAATVSARIDRSVPLKVEVYVKGWIDRGTLDSLALYEADVACEPIAYNVVDADASQRSAAKSWRLPPIAGGGNDFVDLELRVSRTANIATGSVLEGADRYGSVAVSAVRLTRLAHDQSVEHQPAGELIEAGKQILLSASGRLSMIVAAERRFRDAISSSPHSPSAHYWLAEALCYQGRLPEAVPFALAALELDAQSAKRELTDADRGHLHTRIGEGLLLQDERHDEAAHHLERAVALKQEARHKPLSSPGTLLQGLRTQSPAERSRGFARWPIPVSHFADLDKVAEEVAAAVPRLSPLLSDSTRVVALGSCFAKNVAHELRRFGVPTAILGMGELINSTFANRALFEWVLDDANAIAEPSVAEVLKAYFGSDKNEVLRHFREAETFIYTLGVAPGFFDRDSGRFHLSQPGASTRHLLRTKQFRTTTVAENVDNIEYIAGAIGKLRPDAQVIFSVSPVPLFATFEYDSAIVADCVSKSTLRVAIDIVMKKGLPQLHYWPAFEMIRWLGVYGGGVYGAEDGTSRHVSEHAIRSVMRAFIGRHGDERLQLAAAADGQRALTAS